MTKRIFDIITSCALLITLAPFFLLIAISVRVKLGKPVFFAQLRPGLNGTPFRMLKFRSMTNDRDFNGTLLPNEKRITPFGRFLRSTSLDELPEIWNVLKGEMSLVGPRPLLMEYLDYYNSTQKKRHEVRPGITGWAQINGRNSISWDKKLEYDVWYVENKSILLDLQILALTFWKVIGRDGISQDGHFSMPRFDDFVISQRNSSNKEQLERDES